MQVCVHRYTICQNCFVYRGPDLAGKDDAEKDDGVMKTPQQKAGENILRYICENVAGVSYEFR